MNDQPTFPPQKAPPAPADGVEDGKRLIRLSPDKGSSLAERLAVQFHRLTWRTPLHTMRLKGKYPLKLLAVPKDAILGDARAGHAMRTGHFLFRGQKQAIDDVDFAGPMPSLAFGDYLHSFSWLRDLSIAANREQGAPIAEKIMRKWLAAHADRPSEPAWRADNAGWRLLFWSSHAPLILSSGDLVYRSLVLNCIARTARHLDRSADKAPIGIPRLVAWGGLVAAGLLLPGGGPRRAFGEAGLRRAIEGAFYTDGGTISRSPLSQTEGIALMAMVRAVYDVMREDVPSFLTEAMGRTVPALLGLMHGDGGLGSWQGGGAVDPALVESVVAATGIRTRPLRQARDWGYQRISAGSTVVQIDAAPPPVARLAEAGCASTGAIEVSDGPERLIVNCGGAALAGVLIPQQLAHGLRTTAAHSTLVLADSNSTAILPDGTLGRGVTEVELHRQELQNGSRLELSHDGYVRRLGFIHRRLLLVSSDGKDIRGEDMLLPSERRKRPAPAPYALRFHLAPLVEASMTADGQGALLRIDMGALWQFRCGAGQLTIEESLWVDGDGRPHPTHQLVVSATAETGGSSLGWLLKRVG
ncbi:heparinase II/III family protein [Sphingobium subterraneum]|uniref:Putative heparinase superfamily protein n=1 Tax=Sphingobium subterraneum TaxID=627688 RepID=A0A841J2Z3_9SPHN|nr:heparinase II/III family protein [Sphingobium subterraneum]MBB6125187.1 putative heparinase superfamily protein [Sphingobium subterraneum]